MRQKYECRFQAKTKSLTLPIFYNHIHLESIVFFLTYTIQ